LIIYIYRSYTAPSGAALADILFKQSKGALLCGNNHWVLMVADLKDKSLIMYNSLPRAASKEEIL
jgi:hypothetical protein